MMKVQSRHAESRCFRIWLVTFLMFLCLVSVLPVPAGAETPFMPAAPLWAARDRLLAQYAERLDMPDACTVWNWMNPVRRAVFLTISHNLWHHYLYAPEVRYMTNEENTCEPLGTDCTEAQCLAMCTDEQRCMDPGTCRKMDGYTCWEQGQCERVALPRTGPRAEKLIDHVDKVYAVLDGGDPTGIGSCGGLNNNRVFFSLDSTGIFALRNITMGFLPGIKQSGDLGGPHSPFTGSRETITGQPRGQMHYFLWDHEAESLSGRREVGDVLDPWAVEMDIDYDWKHDSNPLCASFMEDYRNVWGEGRNPPWWPVEYNYTPGGCQGNRIDSVADVITGEATGSPGRPIVIRGSGFAAEGNQVFFVKDALNQVGPVDPLTQAETEIRVTMPNLLGNIYVYVVDGAGRHSNTQMLVSIPRSTVVSVNGASYDESAVAVESIVAGFGSGLATRTATAETVPLPSRLAGTSVLVRDSRGTERPAPLFFVSPNQVNFQIPPGTEPGDASVTITSEDGAISTGSAHVTRVAPGIFSASSDGRGLPAGYVVRVKTDGTQTIEPVGRFDSTQNKYVAVPIDLGPPEDELFLVLHGTGIRFQENVTVRIGGVAAEVSYAGAQGYYVGVDQVNVSIPRACAGGGEVAVTLTVDGKPANTLSVTIK